MAGPYEIRLSGPLFQADAAQLVDRAVVATLSELGALGQRLVTSRTPRGVSSGGGGLRGSVFTELRGQPANRAVAVASSVFYAPPVEYGRRPGKQPPVSALRLWVRRKLGVPPAQERAVAFAVARKIGRVGFSGFQMFGRTRAQLEPIARQRFEQMAADLARRLGGR